ncbi:MAG: OTU domain-containing protein, partial [Bacteroidota bacterium]
MCKNIRPLLRLFVVLCLFACGGNDFSLGAKDDEQPSAKVRNSQQREQQQPEASTAAHYGFNVQKINGDGNCLFRAVADQLQAAPFKVQFPPDKDHYSIIRWIAVAHVKDNAATYKNYFPTMDCSGKQIEFADVADWLTKMRRDKTWGGEVALRALSEALQVTLVTIRTGAELHEPPTIYKPRKPRGIIYVHYQNGNHYESLYRMPSLSAEQQKRWEALQRHIAGHAASKYQQPLSLATLIQETSQDAKVYSALSQRRSLIPMSEDGKQV